MKATIIISNDDVYTYFLGIDLSTGHELFRRERYTYDDDFNEDAILDALQKEFGINEAHVIYWLSTR